MDAGDGVTDTEALSLSCKYVEYTRALLEDCVLEFDMKRDELTLWFSRLHPVEVPMTRRFSEFVEDLRRVAHDVDDFDRLVAAFGQCRSAGPDVPTVCRCRLRASNAVMWVETTFARESENKVFCCTNDVTDRVAADHERAWSSERYRILSELTDAVSFDYDSGSDTATFFFGRPAVSATGGEGDVRAVRRYLQDWPASRSEIVHPHDAALSFLESVRSEMAGIEASGAELLDACGVCPQEGPVRMTVSVGTTEICPTDRTIREVVLRSDQARYDAKNSGKNRVRVR